MNVPEDRRFGDVLKYRDANPVETWRFMYLAPERNTLYLDRVLVLAVAPGDDLWIAGETILTAARGELEPE